MLLNFKDLVKNVNFKAKLVNVDNLGFQLHYRLTFWLLLVCTVLVTSRQYIGEHIRCISDTIAPHVIETFCFFTTTFTVVRHLNNSQAPHPGVGPLGRAELEGESLIHHAYYQWVPFVLFGQAILFYLPHRLWSALEGGTVKQLVHGLEHSYLALQDDGVNTQFGSVPSKGSVQARVKVVRLAFLNRLCINQWWGYELIACEMLNAINLLAQWMLIDGFLGGRFIDLGPQVLRAANNYVGPDPLDIVFPKVTKCTFQKYGPSGTIQQHDALCVMALNVINEKIYVFLWFWFVFLVVSTLLGMLWRIATLVLFKRSMRFSGYVFHIDSRVNRMDFETVIKSLEFSDWIFLRYITKNMHIGATAELFSSLALEMEDRDKMSQHSGRRTNGYPHDANTLPMKATSPLLPESTASSGSRRGSLHSDSMDDDVAQATR